jgi:hypothetical protein
VYQQQLGYTQAELLAVVVAGQEPNALEALLDSPLAVPITISPYSIITVVSLYLQKLLVVVEYTKYPQISLMD